MRYKLDVVLRDGKTTTHESWDLVHLVRMATYWLQNGRWSSARIEQIRSDGYNNIINAGPSVH